MMHGIGQPYIVTRAVHHPELFEDPACLQQIIHDWHAQIGKPILENWEFAEEIAQAVANQEDLDRESDDAPDLSDVIAISILMRSFRQDFASLEMALQGVPAARRLGLQGRDVTSLIQDVAAEIGALRSALEA
jgi:HD-like signal output (HDOD) protein